MQKRTNHKGNVDTKVPCHFIWEILSSVIMYYNKQPQVNHCQSELLSYLTIYLLFKYYSGMIVKVTH